jgi:hypothetical protein
MKKLKEIVVKTPSESLSPEIVNSIKTIVVEFIVEQLKFAANSYLKRTANIVDYYFQPDVLDVFTSFITDQMIFNNYEVFKNGKEILVSHNNRNMINEEDIRDYIESNPELQSYLRQLLYTFYQKNVDVGCLTKAALQQAYKDQRYFKKKEDAYDSSDVLLTVEYAMENNDCNYYGFPDVIEDNDFNGFLTQEFNKADVIKEIKVQPYNFNNTQPLKGEAKIETDYFREGYLMYLVDLGSYYTFMPYGDQQLVVLIPKQYIEILDPPNDLWATEEHVKAGINNIKNLISQNKIEMAKPTQTESVKSFKDLLLELYQKKVKSIIQEYSEKTINSTIERWKTEDPQLDVNTAKQLIQRFDQVKSGLAQKLDILSLSDELKQGNNYLNIEKYSYDDMVKLIRSLPENPEKKKKEAIEKFVKNELIDKQTAQSYVARFMKNVDNLKYAVSNGLEDRAFTKEEVKELIPSRLLNNDAYLDPRNWRWASFEQMLDALFPSQKKAEGETNLAETDADKIYSENRIEIYKGDDVHKCISYNPVSGVTGRKKYGWCVTQVGNTNYDYYRFRDAAPTFYFIFDRSKDSSPEHSPFVDKWHAFVIQVTADQKTYIVTDAENRGDIPTKPEEGWEGIAKIVPADTWTKIKNLKDYFKPISLSSPERARKLASGKNLSLQEFKELSQDEKILYVQGKAPKNQLTPEILKILPQYKINYDGRSTTLANIAIDSGQRYKYDDLKDYEALAKRYAIFRFRHTNYGKEPISLPFVKYLDEEAQQKYLETFDGNLTFEYIDKYFGEKAARNYVEAQAKDLKFLPPSAIKYIQDPNLKKFYELFFKLSTPWRYSSETNIDEKDLENLTSMPTQVVTPVPINKEQWTKLSPVERKTVMDLTEKFNGDNKYEELLYALPIIVKDGNKKYVILPENNTDDFYAGGNWLIMDEQGNVVKNDIPGSSSLGDLSLMSWYPSEFNEYKKVYDINDLNVA